MKKSVLKQYAKLIAKVGDIVEAGDVIMEIGSSGWSTGPHLHFEVRYNGTPIDSLDFLNNHQLPSDIYQCNWCRSRT